MKEPGHDQRHAPMNGAIGPDWVLWRLAAAETEIAHLWKETQQARRERREEIGRVNTSLADERDRVEMAMKTERERVDGKFDEIQKSLMRAVLWAVLALGGVLFQVVRAKIGL